MKFLTPNVMQFIGGAIAVLFGAYVLKGSAEGPALVLAGVFAMGNALKSTGQVIDERKRKSVPPPREQ